MLAQPNSRLSVTRMPYLSNNPNSCAMTNGAESVKGTNPTRSDRLPTGVYVLAIVWPTAPF
jgi:hypothetical protein